MSTPSGRTTLRRILASTLAIALLLGVIGGGVATGEERLGPRRQMLALTNDDRVRHDRRSLEFAERLARYARRHSQEMADAGRLFHSTADELRGALEGYEWSLGGENIGVGGSLEVLEEAFMSSLPHRENILRRVYDHAAVGVVRGDDDRLWVTVIFYG
jgi:uncharacterized protein YkwD